ncbi:aldehyde ferredoxin oxidoreductase family protein [Chloroflexota bacterium]
MKNRSMYGYAGKVLRVDLSDGSVTYEPTMKYAQEWLGGGGIDQWILYNEVKPWITPYAPANRLTFGAGPLVGTMAPGSSRISAGSKNALTLGVGSSNCDSRLGPELKFAGYDHLIFQGKARRPVYLWIDDGRVEIRDATHLWGKTTWETVDSIRNELGDDEIHLLSIGPAGENIVRGACIIQNKGRAFGRCGLGGVMGSKNLKAVAIRGTGAIEVADGPRFMRVVDELRQRIMSTEKADLRRRLGTPELLPIKQKSSSIPYKNFQYLGLPDELYAILNQEEVQRKYKVRNISYMGCPIGCDRYFWISDGPYAGLASEGYQWEVVANFGGKLAVADPSFMIKMNAYCNQLGMDIDGIAGPIAWAMECYQRDILKKEDTDGLELEWGDAGVILELTRKIAYREGFGNILGEGCAHAAELLGRGSEYFAMHTKGQDLYETIRPSIGMGLGACVSTRGGGHTTGSPAIDMAIDQGESEPAQEVYDWSTSSDPSAFEGKAKTVAYIEKLTRINNSLGICHFVTTWSNPKFLSLSEMAELYSAATGRETTEGDLRRAATRMLNIEKAFNLIHTDFNRKDDYPPQRALEESIPSGAKKGWKLETRDWDKLLDEYYEMNNWDKKTSFPTRKCLEELDLKHIAGDLEKIGKLGDS